MWWLLFGLLALGPAAFIFLYMKRCSKKAWPTKVDNDFKPRISIIVPTYNESSIITFKLVNLSRLKYPKDLSQVLVVDSNSSDDTVEIVRRFSEKTQSNIRILVEKERKGKSHALNYALQHSTGDVVIVSDADCFWPSDILEKALPFLADQGVGVIGGPKILLNSGQNWVTRLEAGFLKSANSLRLGESKAGSTLFYEGGFIAFKREAIDRFDPYGTGSDDNGTVIRTVEKNLKAMHVPEAKFYTTFSSSFRGRLSIKLRRTTQLVLLFAVYFKLLAKGKVKSTKTTVIPNVLLYLFSPLAFVAFMIMTVFVAASFPYIMLFLLLLLIPKVRFYSYEILESNLLLVAGILGAVTGKSFSVWNQPEDRVFLNENALNRFNLI